jgi:hypothetical protein
MKVLIGLLNVMDSNFNVTHLGPFIVENNDKSSILKLLIEQKLIFEDAKEEQFDFDIKVLDDIPLFGVGLKGEPKDLVVAFIDGTILDKE